MIKLDEIKYIDELDIDNKVVFIRCDFNVPIVDGEISDYTRIDESLPTIKYAIEKGCKVVLGSHMGRPKGKVDKKYSLMIIVDYLRKQIKRDIVFVHEPYDKYWEKIVEDLKSSEVILLENLRFTKKEKENNDNFAKLIADNIDVYINDAFATSHRAHASTHGVAKFVKEKGAGFLIKKEIKNFNEMLDNSASPFVAVLGGAKVSSKIGVIESLMEKVDTIIIGGAMANTFMAAKSYDMGKSMVEKDDFDIANKILDKAKENNTEIILPVDFLGADEFSKDSKFANYPVESFPKDKMALDIGKKTIENYRKILLKAKTVFWNGPMGVFEFENFAQGTLAVAVAITKSGAYSVVGGGDSVSAIKHLKLEDKFNHISTGGGASLEYVEGKELPALTILK